MYIYIHVYIHLSALSLSQNTRALVIHTCRALKSATIWALTIKLPDFWERTDKEELRAMQRGARKTS